VRANAVLWAIMMRLSSFTPSSMTVSPRTAIDGSVAHLTSMPTDAADLRHLDPAPFLRREARSRAAHDRARLMTQRAPGCTRRPMNTRATNRASSPTTAPCSMTLRDDAAGANAHALAHIASGGARVGST
jgi:hypothetical protein